MGQSISRQHSDSNSAASSSLSTANTITQDVVHDSEPTLVPETRRSRRESIRKSILSLVRPSARSDSQNNRFRKSWRNSRRWSKAPRDSSPQAVTLPQDASNALPPPSSMPVTTKGKEVDRDGASPSESPVASGSQSTVASHSSITPPDTPDNLIANPNDTENQASSIGRTQNVQPQVDQDEVVVSPDSSLAGTTTTPAGHRPASAAADTPAPSSQPQPPAHQFPPPGTLVVVQGVVHTTDVPRASTPLTAPVEVPELTPRPSSTPPSTSDRLSSHPTSHSSSTTSFRPASRIGTLSPSNTSTTLDATHISEAPVDPISPHTITGSIPASSNTNTTQNTGSLVEASSNNDPTPGTISSGSIDVLGTLLSVAAAATAASLLTGTSEPLLLPPNLTSPAYNPPTTNNETHDTNTPSPPPIPLDAPNSRPTSPTPTAGLGFDTTRAERLRHAWGSIRDRLGLRPSPSLLNHNPPNPDTDGTNFGASLPGMTPPIGDPREHLFGQMARAFNLGLGLNGDSSSGSGSTPTPTGGNSEGTRQTDPAGLGQLPREGSFERFLVDLQRDLRVALTSTNGLIPSETDIPSAEPAVEPPPTSSVTESGPITQSLEHQPEEGETIANNEEDMPPLQDVSDSESELDGTADALSDADEDNITVSRAFSADHGAAQQTQASGQDADDVQTGAAAAASASSGESQTPIPEIDSQGRINWWRLYRFPPIASPAMQGVPANPPAGSNPVTNPPSPPSPSSSTVMDSALSELPFANEPLATQPQTQDTPEAPFSVVPVIVVGVQSVNAPWLPRGPAEEDAESAMEDPVPTTAQDPPTADADETNQGRTRGGRGRGWHSRAAEAIRNLRSTRRNRNPIPPTGSGSRTFLIYVIGGYYPPNHSILNGGPDTLASLEALLELADLLGHAKPPTATKEDIQKSGLELIKSAQLEQYEKDQKISSNCIERCLICLDEYEPDDNIRLMACRHGFHQTCVDKWLETGRNNCPACRSKGVSVGGNPDL